MPASGGFPAPPAPEPRAAHFSPSHPRRAVADRTACLHQRFPKFPWRLPSPSQVGDFFLNPNYNSLDDKNTLRTLTHRLCSHWQPTHRFICLFIRQKPKRPPDSTHRRHRSNPFCRRRDSQFTQNTFLGWTHL